MGLYRGFTVPVTRGIEWSLRVFASMRAVRQFIFASTSSDQFSHASSEQFMTERQNRPLQVPPVVPYKAFGNFTNGEQRALCKASASWNLSLLKRCFAPSNLADTFKTGQQAQS